jgi:hypothetical protein
MSREQGVLAEKWQRELKVADAEGRFAFAGIMFGVGGRNVS